MSAVHRSKVNHFASHGPDLMLARGALLVFEEEFAGAVAEKLRRRRALGPTVSEMTHMCKAQLQLNLKCASRLLRLKYSSGIVALGIIGTLSKNI